MLSEELHIDRIPIMDMEDLAMDPTVDITLNTITMITRKRTKVIHITMEILSEHLEIMLITNPL